MSISFPYLCPYGLWVCWSVTNSLVFPPKRDRTDKQIKEYQDKLEKKKGDIIQAQAGLQASAGGGGGAAPAPGQVASARG